MCELRKVQMKIQIMITLQCLFLIIASDVEFTLFWSAGDGKVVKSCMLVEKCMWPSGLYYFSFFVFVYMIFIILTLT
jgi:hypothetical protein